MRFCSNAPDALEKKEESNGHHQRQTRCTGRRLAVGSGLLLTINEYLPRADYGPTNPNTGQMHHDFMIGAENGRIIDLRIHKSYLRQWTPKDWQSLTHFLTLQGWERAADIKQMGQDDEREYVFSYWWD